jgi:hypothetical protein
MNEAVTFFVSRAQVPMNALSGFINPIFYPLRPSPYQGFSDAIKSYLWPETAMRTRADGGLIRLIVDGEIINPEILSDPRTVQVRLSSLQNQAANTLLYGTSHRNAVADLLSAQIHAPANVSMEAQIIETPEPISVEAMARGKAIISFSGEVVSGTFTVTNQTNGEDISINLPADLSITDAVHQLSEEVNGSDMDVRAVPYAHDIRFYTTEQGSAAYAELLLDAGTTGLTPSSTDVALEPKETEEIMIDQTHQDTLAIAALNHLLFNVASLGGAPSPEMNEPEAADE